MADVAATTGDIQRITGKENVFVLSRNVQERDGCEFIDCRDMENNPVNPEPSPFVWMKDAVLPANLPNDRDPEE